MATTLNGTAGNDFFDAHANADYYLGQLVLVLAGMPSQGGWPTVNILVNGSVVLGNVQLTVDIRDGHTQTVSVPLPAGAAVTSVGLQYVNDLVTQVDDRNVYVGSVTLNGHALDLAAATYTRLDYPTIPGQHDMDWNGSMVWSGAPVQAAMAGPTHADNVVVEAGAGTDTVLYQGRASDYTVGFTADGFTVTPKNGAWGTDTVVNTENVVFDDRGSSYGGGFLTSVDAPQNVIDGGTGLDTLYLRGTHTQYQIAYTGQASNGFSITGNGVQEFVTNVERLAFSDGYIGLDVKNDGGMAYRMYQAAFNRQPDTSGLGFWVNAMDKGVTLTQVADAFIASAEFQATYGNLDNAQFVNQLYQNVLHRGPDASGFAFWQNVLDTHAATRAEVLGGFSESAENQANVIGAIQNGFYFTLS
jgi:hypothetical protein